MKPHTTPYAITGHSAHAPVLLWLVLVAAIGFGGLVLWQHGALARLLEGDPSRISLAILGLFVLTSVHAGARAYSVSRELKAAEAVAARLDAASPDSPLDALPDCLLTRHVRLRLGVDGAGAAPLYAALERQVLGAHEIGWLLSDLMVKLGLLGTVLGFIVMLGSVDSAQDLDIAAMRNILLDMSGGMRIALYTTLSGLTAGVLLGLQYHVVERGAESLLSAVAEITETCLSARSHAPAPATAKVA